MYYFDHLYECNSVLNKRQLLGGGDIRRIKWQCFSASTKVYYTIFTHKHAHRWVYYVLRLLQLFEVLIYLITASNSRNSYIFSNVDIQFIHEMMYVNQRLKKFWKVLLWGKKTLFHIIFLIDTTRKLRYKFDRCHGSRYRSVLVYLIDNNSVLKRLK